MKISVVSLVLRWIQHARMVEPNDDLDTCRQDVIQSSASLVPSNVCCSGRILINGLVIVELHGTARGRVRCTIGMLGDRKRSWRARAQVKADNR